MLTQNIIIELTRFVDAVSTNCGNAKFLGSSSMMRTSLHLLEDLPAARDIVFEYFALVVDHIVQKYVTNGSILQMGELFQHKNKLLNQTQNQTHGNSVNQQNTRGEDDICFDLIQETLENYCKISSAWGALIASWSLDLVGRLSDKYTQRKMTVELACNYWLSCSTIRTLLSLVSISFRKLNNADSETCVENLLNVYQRYPVTSDWMVARLGGCFPEKIISHILQSSLKRFADDFRCQFDAELGILEYISYAHENVLYNVLRDLIQEGFNPRRNLDTLIIPLLLVLGNFSDVFLQSVVNVFLDIFTDDLCTNIVQKSPLWINNPPFAEMQPSLDNIALRLKSHGARLLLTAARMAEQYIWCQEFLEYSLQELEQIVLSARLCPIMNDLVMAETKVMLWKSCLSANTYEQQTAVRLLLIVSVHHSHIYYQTISELLRQSYTQKLSDMGAIIRIMSGFCGVVEFPDIKPGLQMVLEDVTLQEQFERSRLANATKTCQALNAFTNLNILTKMQKKNNFPCMKQYQLLTALNDCLPKILQLFDVILNKLLLDMNNEADDRCVNNFRSSQNYANNNDIHIYTYKKSKRIKLSNFNVNNLNDCNKDEPMECVEDDMNDESDDHILRLKLTHIIVDVLNTIEAGSKNWVMRTTEILKLSVLSVKYFFICLQIDDLKERSAAVNRAFILFKRQCRAYKISRTTIVRELIEGALFYYRHIFGLYEEPIIDELQIPASDMVLLQNQRQSLGPNANRTTLHAGLIGRGLRPEGFLNSNNCLTDMQALFIQALEVCCNDPDTQAMIEAYSTLSLLLVELVSTDVMYNGLPFPDEEFTKVTMERDLMIRRAFVTSPLLWALLGFLASHRPSLCFSSVLLRGLCATCLHQWRAKNVNKFQMIDANDELMQCTKNLLKILAMGQLLLPPLSNLHVVIEYFEPLEIALILKECVWNYLKDHVPSPGLFNVNNNGLQWRNPHLCKVPTQYSDTLRNLMQKKLSKLGQHYYQMFIMPELVAVNTMTSNINSNSHIGVEAIATTTVQSMNKENNIKPTLDKEIVDCITKNDTNPIKDKEGMDVVTNIS